MRQAVILLSIAALAGCYDPPAAKTQTPTPSTPVELRGIPLGITLSELEQRGHPDARNYRDAAFACGDEVARHVPAQVARPYQRTGAQRRRGQIFCNWFAYVSERLAAYTFGPAPIDLAGIPAIPRFEFLEPEGGAAPRLVQVELYVRRDRYHALVDLYAARWGEPQRETTKAVTSDRMLVDSPQATWSNATGSITATMYSPERDLSRITYRAAGDLASQHLQRALREIEHEKQERAEKAKKL